MHLRKVDTGQKRATCVRWETGSARNARVCIHALFRLFFLSSFLSFCFSASADVGPTTCKKETADGPQISYRHLVCLQKLACFFAAVVFFFLDPIRLVKNPANDLREWSQPKPLN